MADGAHAWFACRTRERRERRAQQWLGERGVDTYLPVLPRRVRARRFAGDPPMFPGHLFVRSRTETVRVVLHAPAVEGLVRTGREPVAIPDEEIENIAQFEAALHASGVAVVPSEIPDGPPVQVTRGHFRGIRGILQKDERMVVGLAVLGIGLAVEIAEARVRRLL